MFLRQSHRKNKNGSVTAYYSLAESVRVSDKKNPATRIVHNFGRADKVDVESLKRLVDSINRVIDGAGGSDASDLKSFEEFLLSQRLGVPLVASSIFERMGLGEIIGSRISKKVRNGPVDAHVRICVLALIIQRTAEIETGMTWRTISQSVSSLKAITYEVEKKLIVRTTKITDNTDEMLKKARNSAPSQGFLRKRSMKTRQFCVGHATFGHAISV